MLSYLIKHITFKNNIPHLPFFIVDATRSISTHNDWMMFFVLSLSFIDSFLINEAMFHIIKCYLISSPQLRKMYLGLGFFSTWLLQYDFYLYQTNISLTKEKEIFRHNKCLYFFISYHFGSLYFILYALLLLLVVVPFSLLSDVWCDLGFQA